MGRIRKGSKTKWWGPRKPKINRERERERLMRLRLQELIFPACLPAQDNLQAVYFGQNGPSEAGVLTDESGNSNNAQLVDSNCLSGDGATYAVAGTEDIHDGVDIPFHFIISPAFIDSYELIFSKYKNVTGELQLYTEISPSNKIILYAKDNLGAMGRVTFVINAMAEEWYDIKGIFSNGVVTWTVNNGAIQNVNMGITNIRNSDSPIEIHSFQNGQLIFNGQSAKLKFGNAEFNCAAGGKSITLHNTGTAGGNANLTGYSLPTLWGTQDIHHRNILKGFDLWENGTAGEEIRVPIGDTVSEAGYTFTSTNPAGNFHNNAESKLQVPGTLKGVVDLDVPNPVVYPLESNYNEAFTTFSNTKENENKYLVFYDVEITENSDLLQIQNCLKMPAGELVLGTEELTALTTEEDLILEGD